MKDLRELLERASAWPTEAQEELVAYGRELESAMTGTYHATQSELAGIDRGLEAADAGAFSNEPEVREAFARFGSA